MQIDQDLRSLALKAGADVFGIANLVPAREAILEQWGESVAHFPRAISIGIFLPDSIVDLLAQRGNADVAQEYKRVYDRTNQRLDQITAQVVTRVVATGATALAVRASNIIDSNRHYGAFSHKMAAHLSGLGWIGKSCLLITPEVGPRIRFATVLTDAPLVETGGPVDEQCGDCSECVNSCPAAAFTGRAFRAEEHRDLRFDTGKCVAYTREMGRELGCAVLCGLCVSVCPRGKRHRAQQTAAH